MKILIMVIVNLLRSYDLYAFDFSYLTTSLVGGDENHPLAETLRFSLSIGWGSTPEKIQGFPRGI